MPVEEPGVSVTVVPLIFTAQTEVLEDDTLKPPLEVLVLMVNVPVLPWLTVPLDADKVSVFSFCVMVTVLLSVTVV